ncbi:hypothetical protein KH388_08790 [Serratia rubidaea]|nr:hypothetical protein [Serratia rubidaea]
MECNIIDILLDTELYDDINVSINYKGIKDDLFYEYLKRYHDNFLKYVEPSIFRTLGLVSPLNIYMPNNKDIEYFRKSLLTMDVIILDDEIINSYILLKDADVSNAIIQSSNSRSLTDIAKNNVANFMRFIKNHSSLISNGTLGFVYSPAESYDSDKKKKVLINEASDLSIKENFSIKIVELYKNALSVTPVKRLGNTNKVKILSDGDISGNVIIEIKNCSSDYVNGYEYSLGKTYYDEGGNLKIDFNSLVKSIPRDKETYQNWVDGVVNRTIQEHFTHLNLNIELSGQLNSSLATKCEFTGNVLNEINRKDNIKRKMLEIKTPFLNGISVDTIAKIKNDYGGSFNSYKKILKDTAFKLELATSSEHIDIINNEFKEKVLDEGMHDVNKALNSLKKSAVKDLSIDAGLAVLGFLGTVITPKSLLLGLVRPMKTVQGINKNLRDVKTHPSYFILKTIKK